VLKLKNNEDIINKKKIFLLIVTVKCKPVNKVTWKYCCSLTLFFISTGRIGNLSLRRRRI